LAMDLLGPHDFAAHGVQYVKNFSAFVGKTVANDLEEGLVEFDGYRRPFSRLEIGGPIA